MTEAEKKTTIEHYVQAYNSFDIDGMLANLDNEIFFQNVSGGEVTLEISGIDDFKKQAEQAAHLFSERKQKIKSFVCRETECEIEIDYVATLATDLPNGMKAGEKIQLSGKSIFRFTGKEISEIRDIS